MRKKASIETEEILAVNDGLHEGLSRLSDIRWGDWWIRCVQFHVGKGHYRSGDHFDWHLHRELQLEIPLAGEFHFTSQGFKTVKVRPAQVYVIPPETIHRWKCVKAGMMIGASLAVVPRPESVLRPVQENLRPHLLAQPSLPALCRMLLTEFESRPSFESSFADRIACWMFLILTSVLGACVPASSQAAASASSPETQRRSQRVVSTLMRYIDANLGSRLSIARFADEVGLSSRHINRLFVEVTGKSCHAFVLERRLDAARSLLTTGDLDSVKEISYATGFASPAHFSSSFKKAFGVSPTEFRDESHPFAGRHFKDNES